MITNKFSSFFYIFAETLKLILMGIPSKPNFFLSLFLKDPNFGVVYFFLVLQYKENVGGRIFVCVIYLNLVCTFFFLLTFSSPNSACIH